MRQDHQRNQRWPVEECFVVTRCCGITLRTVVRTHCEDQSSRTSHRLNACDIVSDQLRHGASDQGDQNRVETSNRTSSGRCASVTSGLKSFVKNRASSVIAFSWFSRSCATTPRLWESSISGRAFVIQDGCPLLLELL